MDEDFATSFYEKMERKTPPMDGGVLGAAQKAHESPSVSPSQSSNQTASSDVEPSDEPAEATAQEIDEQRRPSEAAMATSLYDLPMGDGVRNGEPGLTSPNEFSLDVPADLSANLQPGEAEA